MGIIDDFLSWFDIVFIESNWVSVPMILVGLADAPKRGNYIITALGRKFFSEHKDGFDKVDLMQIPSFARFVAGREAKPKATAKASTGTDNQIEESTPTDIIDDAFRQINSALAKDLLTKILEMSPLFFEKLVVVLRAELTQPLRLTASFPWNPRI